MRRARRSVLNADDPAFGFFAGVSRDVVSYGIGHSADWRATAVEEAPGLLTWNLHVGEVQYPAALPMVGSYNVHNALAALAAAHEAGLGLPALLKRLRTFGGVPGRMQLVQAEPFVVVVDFAHTAPALAKALGAVRPQIEGKLIVVIGAAGERDPGKRAPLGEASARYADLAIFTEEDSRSEGGSRDSCCDGGGCRTRGRARRGDVLAHSRPARGDPQTPSPSPSRVTACSFAARAMSGP